MIWAQRVRNPPPGFDELTVEEKLDDVQTPWDRVAAEPETVPVQVRVGRRSGPAIFSALPSIAFANDSIDCINQRVQLLIRVFLSFT